MKGSDLIKRSISNPMEWLGSKVGYYHSIGDIVDMKAAEGGSGEFVEFSFSGLSSFSASRVGNVRVTHSTALKLAVYFACIRNISEDIAKMPLKLYERLPNDTGKLPATEDPLYRILKIQPNPNNTSMIFWQTLMQWALNDGNGYAEIVRNPLGDITALWPIHPSRVTGKFNEREMMNEYEVKQDNGSPITIKGINMIHIRGMGDQFTGSSTLDFASEAVGIGLAQQAFQSKFYQNGTHIDGILSHPMAIGDEAANKLRESFAKRYSGTSNAFKPLVLEEGMKWSPIAMNLNDAQALESRKYQAEDIARYFRTPLHKIDILDHATFTNIESQNQEYVDDTLLPWLTRVEQEVQVKCLPMDSDMFVKFDTRVLLRGDSTSRAAFYKDLFNMGAINQNEIRALEDMNSIGPDGDVYYVPLNMQPVGENADRVLAGRDQGTSAQNLLTAKQPPRFELIEAFRAPILHEASRMVSKECLALEKAAKMDSSEKSIKHMASFYARHKTQMSEAMLPAYQSLIDILGREIDAQFILARVCNGICDASMGMIESHLEKHTIDVLLKQWKSRKAKGLVSQLIGLTEKDMLDFNAEHADPQDGEWGEFEGRIYQYSEASGKWELYSVAS